MATGDISPRESTRINLSGNVTGTLQAAQMPALIGDVTTSLGSYATTVAAIQGNTVTGTTGTGSVVFATAPTMTNPVVGTQSASDNSTKGASTAYVTSAIASAIAGVNPAVAVQAATTSAANTSGLTYNNGVSGVGATFTGSNNTAITWDGYTFTTLGQRGLVKNDTQSPSGAFNGVYYITQVQTAILPPILTRALDYNQPSDINNTGAIPVVNGTVNGTTSWVLTSQVTTVGTDPLTYTQFSINPTTILTTALTSAHVFVGNSSNLATDVAVSGDFTITNTGVATIASSAVTTTKINNAAVTYAKIQNEAAVSLLGNPTGSSATPSEITLGAGLSFSGTTIVSTGSGGTLTQIVAGTGLTGGTITATGTIALSIPVAVTSGGTNLQTLTAHALMVGEGTASVAFVGPATAAQLLIAQGTGADPSFNAASGDWTITSTGVATIANLAVTTAKINTAAVTYAKIQNASATTLLGNPTGGATVPSEITLGSGLSFSGTTLVSTGSGGTVTSVSVVSANGFAGSVATATTTPAITLTTSITGVLKGNGTAISAAVAGTDYDVPATFKVSDMPTYSMFGGL